MGKYVATPYLALTEHSKRSYIKRIFNKRVHQIKELGLNLRCFDIHMKIHSNNSRSSITAQHFRVKKFQLLLPLVVCALAS